MKFYISSSPHIRSNVTVSSIMYSVFIALLPAGIWGVYKFGQHAVLVILTSICSCLLIELIVQKFIFKTSLKISDGSAALTGLLLAYCLPPDIPLWQVIIGAFFAIFITKECFGGLGFNIFNPALVGRAVLLASFPAFMTKWQIDGVTQATPLSIMKEKVGITMFSHGDLFMGNIPGSIGEISKFLLLLGGLFLICRKIISWHIPITFIFSVYVLSLILSIDPIIQIFSGGLILGAFYMATDYVTSPLYKRGKMIFGCGCGLLTILIRKLGSYPEGVCYAILLMNILVPIIDKYTKPDIFGVKK